MSKFGAWLPALAMLAAGFAGGYLFGSGEESSDGHVSLEAGDGDVATRPAASPGLSAEGDAGPALATNAERAALRSALELLPAPEVPRGTGVITGVVKSHDGPPVAGVKVKATPQYPPDEKRDPNRKWEDQPLDEVVRSTVARYWWQRNATRETVTGADGTFRFEGLTSGSHQIRAEHDDYMIHPVDHKMAWQAKPGAHVEFQARAVVPVTIEILLPDGTLPEHVQVSFQSDGGNWGTGWSPQNTTVKQQPGTYQLVVTAGASGEYKADPQPVVLKLGEPQSFTIQLTGRPVLRGNIVWAEGESFDRTQVYLTRLAAGEEPDATKLKSSSQSTWVHRGHRRGKDYSFTDLSPGRYAVGASRADRGDIVVFEVVQVVDGLTEQDLQIPPLSREEYVVLRVFGPDGEPIPDVQVTTGFRSKRGSRSGGGSLIKRPDGSLWVLHNEDGSARDPDGHFFLSIKSRTYGTIEETYDHGPRIEKTVRFGRPASLDIHVRGVAGTRFEGRVQVVANRVKKDERSRRRSYGGGRGNKLDAEGRMKKTGLQPGTYRLDVSVAGEQRSGIVLSEQVEVGAGDNSVNLKLPELHIVTVRGGAGTISISTKTQPAKGQTIYRGMYWARADAEGRAVFDALPAGTYSAHSGSKKAEFTVPGATEIELR